MGYLRDTRSSTGTRIGAGAIVPVLTRSSASGVALIARIGAGAVVPRQVDQVVYRSAR